ncbi:MAG TPA: protein kinase [Anaeromyxobacteraceae bacterium]|nr:protein kinase [Anaeromyxobacteraceae bacterium]
MNGSPERDDGRSAAIRPGTMTALLEEIARTPEDAGGWSGVLRPGAAIGRFELVAEIGRGGFGVVWEARDRELGRSVAFKAVRAGANAGVREERLLREAEAAARLSHPNIVTLHDVGRCPQGPYLVLELLRGRTLAARVAHGALPVREAVRIAGDVARGLAHAHALGVVHRDLKPANVFLCDDGQVKVLDFGMAHAFGNRRVDGGTPAYMAPEQWTGAPEDERTDVFALGVLMYQMLAGELPFPDVRPARWRAAPRLQVPGSRALGDLTAEMLRKDPVRRPRDGARVLEALSQIAHALDGNGAHGAPAARRPATSEARRGRRAAAPARQPAASIAVLPFVDLSPAKDQDYFCDGIAEELLNALSAVPGLRVAARGSSFQFKGRAVDAREVGKALGVATLLDGSVRKAGNRVRIAAQLVSAADGYQLWSESFDRGLEDIFATQEEIAQAVVRALQLRLSHPEDAQLTRVCTRNAQAYEMYLRGRRFLMMHGETGLRIARQMFRGAIELDPSFAQAHAGLADADFMMLQWNFDIEKARERRAEALSASEEALRLEPALAEAHVSRANVLSLLGRADDAERDFRRALELNPALSDACYFYARHLFGSGRLREAAEMFEEAARKNPDDYASLCLLTAVYRGLGQIERATSAAHRAAAAVERRLRHDPDDARALYLGAGVYVEIGERQRGMECLARALELYPDDLSTLYNAACLYVQIGEFDRALDALDRAVATGRGSRKWFDNDNDLDPLRGHPRFRDITARLRS